MTLDIAEYIEIAEFIAVVVTCLLVLWYTLETKRLRAATSEQNQILREQLALARQEAGDARQIRLRAEQPKVRIRSSGGGVPPLAFNLENDGPPFRLLSVEAPDGAVANPSLTGRIRTKERFQIELGNMPETSVSPIVLRVHFEDESGRRGVTLLSYDTESNHYDQQPAK